MSTEGLYVLPPAVPPLAITTEARAGRLQSGPVSMATHLSPRPVDPSPLPGLAIAYHALQQLLLAEPDLDAFLAGLASLAARVIPPLPSCAIMLRRGGKPITVTASDAVARRIDELQYNRGVGPSLQALHTGAVVTVANLADEQRWGDYPSHALRCGAAASMSLPLTEDGPTVGALNLYGADAHEFTAADVAQGVAFAAQASGALALRQRHETLRNMNAQLQAALASRTVIDQAMGVLMGTRHISATEAFDTLRSQSQRRNVKLHVVAAEVVEIMTDHLPEPAPVFSQRS